MSGNGIARIGLTGGIGSGKSTVANMFVEHGAYLVDTDAIARQLTQSGGEAVPALALAFGPSVLAQDGSLDRAAMRGRVFAQADARAQLEAILHPLIGAEAMRQAQLCGGRVVVFDVPLLAESNLWRQRVDRVLVVDCSPEVQTQRVETRDGWTADLARQVIGQQAARPLRRAVADAVIHNDGLTFAGLAEEVAGLWALWTAAAT